TSAHPQRSLGRVLLASGSLVAWLPFLGSAFAHWILPEHLALDEAAQLIAWGSLAVALLVFLPPTFFLGTVSPLVAECMARVRGVSAGRAGGTVLCISTLGSLAGVFSTSYVLLPGIGLKGTFGVAGGVLICTGIWASV